MASRSTGLRQGERTVGLSPLLRGPGQQTIDTYTFSAMMRKAVGILGHEEVCGVLRNFGFATKREEGPFPAFTLKSQLDEASRAERRMAFIEELIAKGRSPYEAEAMAARRAGEESDARIAALKEEIAELGRTVEKAIKSIGREDVAAVLADLKLMEKAHRA